MNVSKTHTRFVGVGSLLLLVLASIVHLMSLPVFAEEAVPPATQCTFESIPSVGWATDNEQPVSVENEWSGALTITNDSAILFPAVDITLGFFAPEADAPSHLAVITTDDLVTATEMGTIDFSVDLSALPAGTYEVQPIVSQGGLAEMVYVLERDREVNETIVIEKVASQQNVVEQTLAINGQVLSGDTLTLATPEAIALEAVTSNNSSDQVRAGTVELVLARGEAAVGTAVRETTADVYRLIPGGSPRTTTMIERDVAEGVYTVLAAPLAEGWAMPLTALSITVGERAGEVGATYLTGVGIEETSAGDAVIACATYVPAGSDVADARLSVVVAEEATMTDIDWTSQRSVAALVVNTPDVLETPVTVTIAEPDRSSAAIPEAVTLPEQRAQMLETIYTPRQALAFTIDCESDDCLPPAEPTPVESTEEPDPAPQLWALVAVGVATGVVLVALLVLLFRREKPDQVDEIDPPGPEQT